MNSSLQPSPIASPWFLFQQVTKLLPANMSILLMILGCFLLHCQPGKAQRMGINFPPTQGTTDSGAFQTGIFNYSYTNAQIAASHGTFNTMRLPINIETANDVASLAKLKGYIDQFPGGYAIICMFDTLQTGETGHGNGLPNNLNALGAAWANVNAVFAGYANVRYEIFNEPFGYSKTNPAKYVSDMEVIINSAGLPYAKCILDGMGYADDINLVASGGWSGDLAYHFYPSYVSGSHTQANYSNTAQAALGSWGQKTWITEFGANLGYNNTCYDTYNDGSNYWSGDVNALRGLDDALRAVKAAGHGVKGAFYWHGWNNGDSYDYWASISANGACKVREIEAND